MRFSKVIGLERSRSAFRSLHSSRRFDHLADEDFGDTSNRVDEV